MKNTTSGFTLLELSIVLVIIGALIGGVMFGRSLIITSRLQAVITDADNYITATGNFKQAYQALPGDMPTAQAQWGTGTSNGNGDGMIGGTSGTYQEAFAFWQQLHLAGMATQNFSGSAGSLNTLNAVIGTNVPAGSIEGSGFSVLWEGGGNALIDSTDFPAGSWGNVLLFGGIYSNNLTTGPILTPDQASSIDAKIDDGIASTGKVRAPLYNSNYAPNCTTNATPAAYNLTSTTSNSVLCPLFFLTGY